MANPAKDVRDKMQAVWPGASVSARGRRSIVHQHPMEPRRFALDTQIGLMHYGVSKDQEIDTAWVASQGAWDYEVVKNDFHCFVRDSIPIGYRYLDAASGESVDLDLDVDAIEFVNDSDQRENVTSFSQVVPVIDDDSITWPDISPGWDVIVQAQTARLAKKLNIDSLANLGSPTLGGTVDLAISFRFQMSNGLETYIDGQLWDKKAGRLTSDHIEFRAGDESVFWFKRPWAADSGDGFLNGSMYVRKAGNKLFVEVRIPWTWLQAASYPIEIDPTIDPVPQVGSSDDDWGWLEPATFSSTNPFIFGGDWVGTRNCGCRFTITGPGQGDICDLAYTEYNARGNSTGTVVLTNLAANNVDDAPAATSYSEAESPVGGRTSAVVPWDGIETWTGGTWYQSPEIKTIIQEIFDRGGWASGQHIVIMWEDDGSDANAARQAIAYDQNGLLTVLLHIEYTTDAYISPFPAFRRS